jgi:hypothetical protein
MRPLPLLVFLFLETLCSAFSPNVFSRALFSTSTSHIALRQSTAFVTRLPRAGPNQGREFLLNRVQRVKPQSLLNLKAMFTGIVEEMGTVSSLVEDPKTGGGVTLQIAGKTVLEGAYEGCSIAVNGVCLTVTGFDQQKFTVSVASNIGWLVGWLVVFLKISFPPTPLTLSRRLELRLRLCASRILEH